MNSNGTSAQNNAIPMAHHYHRQSLSGCSADIKKAGCPCRLLSRIPVAPQGAVGLDVHIGPSAFTFQSYYTVFSIYIHLNEEDRDVLQGWHVWSHMSERTLHFDFLMSLTTLEKTFLYKYNGTYIQKTLIYVNCIVSTQNKSTKPRSL